MKVTPVDLYSFGSTKGPKRPRPGIDRVSSAWLILRFIDPQARFAFGTQPGKVAAKW